MATKFCVSCVFIALLILSSCSNQGNTVTEKKDEGFLKKIGLYKYPSCPAGLSGILTAPIIDVDKVSSMIPLGNLNPPGHTSPVDHVYIHSLSHREIETYVPADSNIRKITEILFMDESGNYVPDQYVFEFVICDGLELTMAGYTRLTDAFKEKIPKKSSECKWGIVKPGHTKTEGQCYYSVDIPVKSGELIGWTKADERGLLPFEVWAADYNVEARKDVDWGFYDDNRYAHIMCLFDLYSGELKDKFYSKFGGGGMNQTNADPKKQPISLFVPRTIEPRCGQVNQNIVGTIQGMWYGADRKKGSNLEFEGLGLSFIHNNIDPTLCDIGVGGNFMKPGVVQFSPYHSGTLNREFSEVKADGNIYCYDIGQNGRSPETGKVLVQLIDDRHLKVEHQDGVCTDKEQFVMAFNYQR